VSTLIQAPVPALMQAPVPALIQAPVSTLIQAPVPALMRGNHMGLPLRPNQGASTIAAATI
jgi:hypothetical protein